MTPTNITVGIDLGTTNSCVAFDSGSACEVIRGSSRDTIIPSVVYMEDGKAPVVGRQAVTEGRDKPEFCFRNVKRLFGQKWRDGETGGYQTVKGPDGMVWLRGPDRDYSPAEIASYVIREMLDCAEFRLRGKRPDGAVITHPAHFTDAQLACVLEAGKLAGLDRVHLLEEPRAAGIAYALKLDKIRHIAVYDMGGGTWDISILHAGGANRALIRPEWTDGLPIGGVDADNEIVDWLKDGWHALHGSDLGADGAAMARLRDAAESAKIILSGNPSARIDLPLIEVVPPRTLTETLTLERFEQMLKPHIDATLEVCQRTLDRAGLTKGNIAEVLLVGGMTNVPAIRKAVSGFFGKEPRADIDPDEVVAIGAANHAAVLDKRRKPYTLENKVNHDFGFETTGNVFHKVIAKGETYPAGGFSKKVLITNEEANQTELSVHVLEGDPFSASEATRLAAADIPTPPTAQGEASLELTFAVDGNGMKSVTYPGGTIYAGDANV